MEVIGRISFYILIYVDMRGLVLLRIMYFLRGYKMFGKIFNIRVSYSDIIEIFFKIESMNN